MKKKRPFVSEEEDDTVNTLKRSFILMSHNFDRGLQLDQLL